MKWCMHAESILKIVHCLFPLVNFSIASSYEVLVNGLSQGWCAESCSLQPVPTIQLFHNWKQFECLASTLCSPFKSVRYYMVYYWPMANSPRPCAGGYVFILTPISLYFACYIVHCNDKVGAVCQLMFVYGLLCSLLIWYVDKAGWADSWHKI